MFIPLLSYAGSASQIFIPLEGDMFFTSDNIGTFTCARISENDPWLVGYLDKKTGQFKSIANTISEKKKLLKKTKDSRKRKKIEKDIEKRKATLKKGAKVCLVGPGGGSMPQATPTPSITNPAPTRTPSPSSNTCFNGDLSKPGCFGLPSGAIGNKRSGATFWENNCKGCHISKSNKNYNELLSAFNKPEMLGLKPSNQQEIYDIVAWLNRFSL